MLRIRVCVLRVSKNVYTCQPYILLHQPALQIIPLLDKDVPLPLQAISLSLQVVSLPLQIASLLQQLLSDGGYRLRPIAQFDELLQHLLHGRAALKATTHIAPATELRGRSLQYLQAASSFENVFIRPPLVGSATPAGRLHRAGSRPPPRVESVRVATAVWWGGAAAVSWEDWAAPAAATLAVPAASMLAAALPDAELTRLAAAK